MRTGSSGFRQAGWIGFVPHFAYWKYAAQISILFGSVREPCRRVYMKKRILAVLLMVGILAALLAGLSVTAAAENDISGDTVTGYVIPYTLKSGDTVLKVCNTLKIDFHKNQAWITKVNSIADYSKLPVGKVIWLPATSAGSASDYYTLKTHKVVSGDNVNTLLSKYSISSTDAMLSKINNNLASPTVGSTITFPVYTGSATAKMADTTTAAIGTGVATATGISTATGVTVPATGSVAYYLLAHTMQAGDTVGAVCTANGINFSQHSALITRINGITNYNRIPVGRTIMLPTYTPTGATYSVVAHQIQAGETANAICASYGINLAANMTLIKGLNNTNNINYIQAGGLLYVPVAGGGGGGGGGGGITPTPTPTPSSGNVYNLTKETAEHGSFILKVDGVEAASSNAGKTVTIVCKGDSGYAQNAISVYMTGDPSKKVTVTNNTFVVPEFHVTVKVTFAKATNYAIKCNTSSNGSYELYVDENLVSTQTYGGAAVTVKAKPVANYMLEKIKVTYKDDKGKEQEVTVTDGKFTMPRYDVEVTVTFKPSAGYEYPLNNKGAVNCTYEFKVDGSVKNKAASGKPVTVSVIPTDSTYKVDVILISYYVWNAKTEQPEFKEDVMVSGQKFTMPAFDDNIELAKRYVDVKVECIKSKTYSITIKTDASVNKTKNTVTAHPRSAENGSISLAEENKRVVLVPKLVANGYQIDHIEVKLPNGTVYKDIKYSDLESDASFAMPASNVTVIPYFKTSDAHKINFTVDPNATWGSAVFMANATLLTVPDAKQGVTVDMQIKPVNDVVRLKNEAGSVKGTYKYDNKDVEFTISGNNFTMPMFEVFITAKFEVVKPEITLVANADVDHVDFTVNSQNLTAPCRVAIDDKVVVKPTMKEGFVAKEIKVTYKDAKGEEHEVTVNASNTFVMPAFDAKVTIVSTNDPAYFAINIKNTANGTVKVLDPGGSPVEKAKKDTEVTVVCTGADGYSFKTGSLTVTKTKDGSAIPSSAWVSTWVFKMPGEAVDVEAEFEIQGFTITPQTNVGGSVTCKLGTTTVTSAHANDTVKTFASTTDGYKFVSLKVYKGSVSDDNLIATITTTEGSFTMPASDVIVVPEFRLLMTGFEISKTVVGDGVVQILVGGSESATADEDAEVTVKATPGNAGELVRIKVNGTVITGSTFTMPASDVAVEVEFYAP